MALKIFFYILIILFISSCSTDIKDTNETINEKYQNHIIKDKNKSLSIYQRDMTMDELKLVDKLNYIRVTTGLKPLKINKTLSFIAHKHAKYCLTNSKITHYENKNDKNFYEKSYTTRANKAKYYKAIGEAIAYNTKKPIDTLLDSIYHRSLLLGDFTEIGISILEDNKSNQYVVINLGGYDDNLTQIIKYPLKDNITYSYYQNIEVPQPIDKWISGYPISIFFRQAFDIEKGYEFIIKDENQKELKKEKITYESLFMKLGYEVHFIPQYPLEVNKTYYVTFKYFKKNSSNQEIIKWEFDVDESGKILY